MMKILIILLPCLILAFTSSCTPESENITSKNKENSVSGKVISITDGDTYDILMEEKRTMRVRMEGIDAPEKGMPFYKVAKRHLSDLCFGKTVTLEITGTDNHGRSLAYTYLEDGRELSHEMVKAGLAWHYKKYNSDTTLAILETEARRLRQGLWVDPKPMAPWVNRSLHRQGISTKDSFDIHENER